MPLNVSFITNSQNVLGENVRYPQNVLSENVRYPQNV